MIFLAHFATSHCPIVAHYWAPETDRYSRFSSVQLVSRWPWHTMTDHALTYARAHQAIRKWPVKLKVTHAWVPHPHNLQNKVDLTAANKIKTFYYIVGYAYVILEWLILCLERENSLNNMNEGLSINVIEYILTCNVCFEIK